MSKPATSGSGTVGAPAQACPAASLADLEVVAHTDKGDPLEGVPISVKGPEGRSGATDASGEVLFQGVKPGKYTASGTKPGYSTASATAVAPACGQGTASLVMKATTELIVTVTEKAASPKPLEGATVELTGPDTRSAQTEKSGEAKFAGLAPGFYTVRATMAAHRAGQATATVKAGKNTAKIQLAPVGVLNGKVIDDFDKAVADAEISVGPPLSRQTKTDAQGEFTFGEVETGSYQIQVSKDGHTATGSATVAVGSPTNTLLTLSLVTITSLKITYTPKRIIHPYDAHIVFTAVVQPAAPAGLPFRWSVDGVQDTAAKGNTLTRDFRPAATVAERRKDYRVSVQVAGHTAEVKVRVAQNTDVGTVNVSQDNAGLDIFGWTDSSPETFDTTLTDEHDKLIQQSESLTRPVRRQTLANGSIQFGRLQFVTTRGTDDMATVGIAYHSPALVTVRASAYRWRREEFESMLLHERRHCQHRTATADPTSLWKKLRDMGFDSTFSPFSEMFGYFEGVQSTTVSYRFLVDNFSLAAFLNEYNHAKTALNSMSGSTKTDAAALIQQCYDQAQYSELRDPPAEGWDLHMDPP